MNWEIGRKIIAYGISVVLIVVSFFLPPLGIIDNSVLMAVGLLIGGFELMFGKSIKSLHIDKTGVHIETNSGT